MGQKISDDSNFSDEQSKMEFRQDLIDIVDEKILGIEVAEEEKMMKSLRLSFVCKSCEFKWNCSFEKDGRQDCPHCKKNKKCDGTVKIPEGYYLIGSVECKKCDFVWKRPVKPKKSGKFRCRRCEKKCSVIQYSFGEGGFNEALQEYLHKKKGFDDRKQLEVRKQEQERILAQVKLSEIHEQEIKKKEKNGENEREVLDGDDDDEKTLCKVCFENEVNCTLVPCGHIICMNCAGQVEKCPFDRKKIKSKVKMFFS